MLCIFQWQRYRNFWSYLMQTTCSPTRRPLFVLNVYFFPQLMKFFWCGWKDCIIFGIVLGGGTFPRGMHCVEDWYAIILKTGWYIYLKSCLWTKWYVNWISWYSVLKTGWYIVWQRCEIVLWLMYWLVYSLNAHFYILDGGYIINYLWGPHNPLCVDFLKGLYCIWII